MGFPGQSDGTMVIAPSLSGITKSKNSCMFQRRIIGKNWVRSFRRPDDFRLEDLFLVLTLQIGKASQNFFAPLIRHRYAMPLPMIFNRYFLSLFRKVSRISIQQISQAVKLFTIYYYQYLKCFHPQFD